MGHWCDGRASVVVGTHTHVPTADAQILPGGTAYPDRRGHVRRLRSRDRHGQGRADAPLHHRHGARAASRRRTGEATLCRALCRDRRPHRPRDPGRAWCATGGRLRARRALTAAARWARRSSCWRCSAPAGGCTLPLAKIAVSEGYRHFGIIFWQLAIGAAILGAITLARGSAPSARSPASPALYAVIALTGHPDPEHRLLSGGRAPARGHHRRSCSSLVPMVAFPIALALGARPVRLGTARGACLRARGAWR